MFCCAFRLSVFHSIVKALFLVFLFFFCLFVSQQTMTHSHDFRAFTICIPHLIFLLCLTLLLFDPDWLVLVLISPIIIASADNLYVYSILSSSHDRCVTHCLYYLSLIFNISLNFLTTTVFNFLYV